MSGLIELQVEIEPAGFEDMANKAPGEVSEAIRCRSFPSYFLHG